MTECSTDPELAREHGGQGMGLEVHEEPMIYEGSDFVLEEGMVVMLENGRYIAGHGGYQLEDLVRVTADGYEVLTSVPRDLVRRS
jgi:Xaa-Pro aminopeptidase